MFSKLRRSFQRGEELSRFQSEERHRSYLNVREFLDDLDLRSNISTAQSEVIDRNKAKKKSKSGRKSNFLSIFNIDDNNIKANHGSRSVSMVSFVSVTHMTHNNKSNSTPICGSVSGIVNHNYLFL